MSNDYPDKQVAKMMAILGFVSSNRMVTLGLFFSLWFPPLGLIFSAIGLSQIKKNPEVGGKKIAIIGLVLSIILIIVLSLEIVIVWHLISQP